MSSCYSHVPRCGDPQPSELSATHEEHREEREIEQLFPRFHAEEVALTTHLAPDQHEQLATLLPSMLRRVPT